MVTPGAPPRPARAWAIAATIGLGASLTSEILVLAFRVMLRERVIWAHHVLHGDGLTVPPAKVLALAGNVPLVFAWSLYLHILTSALTAVVFLFWLFRAIEVARSRGLRPNSTPFGAVVCWFIPPVSFVRPYNVVRSLYRVSRKAGSVVRADWVRHWPWILPVWWWSWLGNLGLKYLAWSGDLTVTRRIWMEAASFGCATVSAACAGCIVWAIQSSQNALMVGHRPSPEFVPPAAFAIPSPEDDDADGTAELNDR